RVRQARRSLPFVALETLEWLDAVVRGGVPVSRSCAREGAFHETANFCAFSRSWSRCVAQLVLRPTHEKGGSNPLQRNRLRLVPARCAVRGPIGASRARMHA